MKHPARRLFSLATTLTASLAIWGLAGTAWAGQLHVHTSSAAGFNTHSVWYDDGKEVTVIDTQFTPALAQELVADIGQQTRSPITRVIVTHPNPDKFNALSIFHALGAKSIGSKATAAAMPGVDGYKRYFWVKIAKAFTDDTYPKLEALQSTFEQRQVIRLKSGETLTLTELAQPGVSSNQTVVRIDKTGDLVVGDLVHHKNHAWLEGGIVNGKPKFDLAGWKADLAQLPQLGTGKVYGGRGQFANIKVAVAEQTAYLDKADAIVRNYINSLGNKVGELSDSAAQGAHHAAIQAEFVKAFPDHAMPDLVGYSVYGLVQANLKAP
jgi:glyoxylase-like metal-dependent hydrolase (beta-lactamase superfamily II)